MTSRQLVDFIEQKFAEHGVTKLVPNAETINRQARRVLHQRLVEEVVAKASKKIAAQV